jgi:hypothetical protein
MASELPGRSESERGASLERSSEGPACEIEVKATWARRTLADASVHFGGVAAAARGQGRAKQLEKPSSSRLQTGRSKVRHITGYQENGGRREGGGWARSSEDAG